MKMISNLIEIDLIVTHMRMKAQIGAHSASND